MCEREYSIKFYLVKSSFLKNYKIRSKDTKK